MKKLISFLLTTVLLLSLIPATAHATDVTATKTVSKVTVDGVVKSFDAYTINGNNYFKLRDIAYILSGTAKQFEVTWDGDKNAIKLNKQMKYTSVGGEMEASIGGNTKTATQSTAKVYLAGFGEELKITAYTIDGNNYFKLRDIGSIINFGVEWDGKNNTIAIKSTTYYLAEDKIAKPTILSESVSEIIDVDKDSVLYNLMDENISSRYYNITFRYADGTFKPKQNITKGEFMEMTFCSFAGFDSLGYQGYQYNSTHSHWAEYFVTRGKVTISYSARKIVLDKFDNPITRAEAAVLAYEYYVLADKERYIPEDPSFPGLSKIKDANLVSEDLKYNLDKSIRAGLISPDENGYLKPDEYITREEAFKLLIQIH